MAKPLKQSAQERLDQLRRDAADERVKVRDLEAQLEAAKLDAESASRAISDGYATESQRDVAQARKAEEAAIIKVKDLQHRLTGAAIRVERTQGEADAFAREHARDLLAEREQPARTVALELSRAVGEVLKLHHAYVTERQTVDRLVAAVPGATPRADGPVPEHPWESALKDLERAYRQATKLEPPTPRWSGLQLREQQDNLSRFEKLRRRKRLTEDEQAEMERLSQ
jgi:hypothetical protein